MYQLALLRTGRVGTGNGEWPWCLDPTMGVSGLRDTSGTSGQWRLRSSCGDVEQPVFLVSELDELGEAGGPLLSKLMDLDCRSSRGLSAMVWTKPSMLLLVAMVGSNGSAGVRPPVQADLADPPSSWIRRLRPVRGVCALFRTR